MNDTKFHELSRGGGGGHHKCNVDLGVKGRQLIGLGSLDSECYFCIVWTARRYFVSPPHTAAVWKSATSQYNALV